MRFLIFAFGLIHSGISAMAATPDTTRSDDVRLLPESSLQVLEQAFTVIKRDYAHPVDDRVLMTGAIKGMVADLDPHSEFLDSSEYKQRREQLEGGFAGVGLQVGRDDAQVRVFTPIEGSPAARAGIRSGDVIVAVDDIPVQGLTLADTVSRMRGTPGTQVTLTIRRSIEPRTWNVVITRAFIHIPSATARVAAPGYGCIRVSGFDERTVQDLAEGLRRLAHASPRLKGLILDLRSNGGGVLQDGVGVAGAFLPANATVVSVHEREADTGHTYRNIYADYRRPSFTTDPLADLPLFVKTLPLVVLINAQSASVTEVVAAALQDTHRATLMGEPSFGKGTIQVTAPLTTGAGLTLTVARYYTPKGRSIQNSGVVPDLFVDASPTGSADQMPPIREIDLIHHLDNPLDADEAIRETAHARDVLNVLRTLEAHNTRAPPKVTPPSATPKPIESCRQSDFVIRQALHWLEHRSVALSTPRSMKIEKFSSTR